MSFDSIKSAPAADHPGTTGIWTFVFIDMIVFALLFLVFVSERFRLPEIFSTSQSALDPKIGLLGTVLLIASSWSVAETVHAVREGRVERARAGLDLALILGVGFAANKLIEYWGKLSDGVTPVSNGFFTFYFLITGLHFLHVVGGLCFLGHCRLRLNAEANSGVFRKKLENTGHFWHFVDMLWFFIFPTLYLTGTIWH